MSGPRKQRGHDHGHDDGFDPGHRHGPGVAPAQDPGRGAERARRPSPGPSEPGAPSAGGAAPPAPRGVLSALSRGLVEALILPIRGYQRFLSPFTPPTCRFRPTCSAYAVEALRTHGLLRGLALSVRRILRCHPFSEPGPDPVPPPRKPRPTP